MAATPMANASIHVGVCKGLVSTTITVDKPVLSGCAGRDRSAVHTGSRKRHRQDGVVPRIRDWSICQIELIMYVIVTCALGQC